MKKKVLVVDNHPMILKLMSNLLEQQECEVKTASDGLAALDILQTFTPDIIFIDLIMPNISGDKLCKIIRCMDKLQNAYIVILSAIAVEEGCDFASYGADACIAKGPFNEIAEHVLTALGGNLKRQQLKESDNEILGKNNLYEREVTKELLSSQRHFEAILCGISEGIVELTIDGRIIYTNPMAAELIGQPEEKLLSNSFFDFFPEKDQKRIGKILKSLHKGGGIIAEEEPADLNNKMVAIKFLPVRDPAITTCVVIILDVTERRNVAMELHKYRKYLEELVKERTTKYLERTKELQNEIAERRQAEQDRQKLQIQLQQKQKMEAIGTLAGGIAHDFNNILSAILGYAELTLIQTAAGSKNHEYLTKILKSVERAADLVRQILTFSRQTELERKPMLMQPVIKETMKLLRGSLPSTIEIDYDIDPECRPIQANFSQIHQVIMNLCTNAYHAMRQKGGKLHISLTEVDLPQDVLDEKPEMAAGHYVRMSVTDTGDGIAPEYRDRIFEPYFTTKTQGEGTGLGLATVHGIVLNHEGTITFESDIGKGTRFDVYFPVLEKKPDSQEESEKEVLPPPRSARILFVDDEEMIVELAQNILERLDCQVIALTNSIEALALFKETPDNFDIVITDQTMPGMTGTELCRKILEIRPEIPIILSTGFSETVNEQQAKEMGITEFIMKPLAMRDLANVIWKALDQRKT